MAVDADDVVDVWPLDEPLFPEGPVADLDPEVGAAGEGAFGALAVAEEELIRAVVAVEADDADRATASCTM